MDARSGRGRRGVREVDEDRNSLMLQSPWGALQVNDAHVHFFSHRMVSMTAAAAGLTTGQAALKLGWDAPPEDPAELAALWAAEMDRHGAGRAALIASVPGDEGSVVCAAARFPERFRGYMMVNPLAERACENAAAVLAGGSMRGICLFPALHGYTLRDAPAEAMVAVAAAHPGTVVFVHCGALSIAFRKKLGLACDFELASSNPLDLHRLAQRHPAVQFVVPHFGAGLFREALMLADLCPNVYFDTSSGNRWMHYDGPHMDLREVFRRAIDVAGPGRLLFGTDSSWFPRGWHAAIFEAQAKALYEIGVSGDDAALIFGGNFDRVFGFETPVL